MILLLVFALLLHPSFSQCPNCKYCYSWGCNECFSGYKLSSGNCYLDSGSSSNDLNAGAIVAIAISSWLVFFCGIACCVRQFRKPFVLRNQGASSDNINRPSATNLRPYNQLRVLNPINMNPRMNGKWQSIQSNAQFQHQQICVVCLSMAVNVQTHCGHGFHSGCIEAWFKASPTCPKCRAEINNISLFCSGCYKKCKKLSLRVIKNVQQYATVCDSCHVMLEGLA